MQQPDEVPPPRFAEVAVNSPFSRGATTFHYALPAAGDVAVGHLVWVPFGSRQLQGVVLDLLASTTIEGIKEIAAVVDRRPVLSPAQVQLARWLATHYAAPLFEAIRLMLPPGAERHLVASLALAAPNTETAGLTPKQRTLVELLRRRGRLRLDQVRATLKMRGLSTVVGQLVRRGLLRRELELHGAHVAPKREKYLRLAADGQALSLPRAPRQEAVLRLLQERGGALAQAEVVKETGCTAAGIATLARRGLITVSEQEVRRDPLAHRRFNRQSALALTPTQDEVWGEIARALDQPASRVFLLHGVTGSGKTELYLRAIAETIARGRRAIVLVHEIALTPQTVHRFASRFPGAVAVLHSKLSPGEQYDEWRRIRDGEAAVVVGSRSALFAPVSPLGLIVVDEEHEWSYKQEKTPRYHARDVAIKLAELSGAKVILGSATPDVVSYYHAEAGAYHLLHLPERVLSGPPAAGQGAADRTPPPLPPVQVVDMRQELRGGNRGIFSHALHEALTLALAAREQAILFLNRRGTASFIMCRDCGYVMRCKRCDVSLVYHADVDELLCHQCNYRTFVPETCPDCWSGRIRFFGIGTQKVEEETRRQFPEARVLRWDRDVTGGKAAHDELMRKFAGHEVDILVGTQMIAKGLDLPLVTLVGVISADTALHLPDMRAGERTFQLLTQVAGRAGRGALGGRAIVQTYSPEHYCVRAASRHDYEAFYRREIEFRRQHAYPPFGRLVRLLYSHAGDAQAHREAARLAEVLRQKIAREGLPALAVIGPAPAYRRRLRGRFRWQVLLRGAGPDAALQCVPIPRGWLVDVDPLSLL